MQAFLLQGDIYEEKDFMLLYWHMGLYNRPWPSKLAGNRGAHFRAQRDGVYIWQGSKLFVHRVSRLYVNSISYDDNIDVISSDCVLRKTRTWKLWEAFWQLAKAEKTRWNSVWYHSFYSFYCFCFVLEFIHDCNNNWPTRQMAEAGIRFWYLIRS